MVSTCKHREQEYRLEETLLINGLKMGRITQIQELLLLLLFIVVRKKTWCHDFIQYER